MANQSPHPNSLSPRSRQSAFQWPIPSSPSQSKANNVGQPTNLDDITVKEILDRYSDDPELLKYILTAKSEEDKKKAARDTLKAEEARIQLRQMDLDIAREQSKASLRYDRSPAFSYPVYPHQYIAPQTQPFSAHPHLQSQQPPQRSHSSHNQPQLSQQQHKATQQHQQPQSAHPTIPQAHSQHPSSQHQQQQQPHQQQQQVQQLSASYPYYGLAPVQQQVLARFNYPAPYGPPGHHAQPPPSPSVPYPHSAHPLCPPTTASTTNKKKSSEDKSSSNGHHPHQRYTYQQSPTSPATTSNAEETNVSNTNSTLKKRNRSSFSAASNEHVDQTQQQLQHDKLSHNKVMEALKAKIQRGNGGPQSSNGSAPSSSAANAPTSTTTTSAFTTSSVRSTTHTHAQEMNNGHGATNKRRKPTLPKPAALVQQQQSKAQSTASPSPSPRSAKPILPPIDTSLGRADATSTKLPSHPLSQHQSSSSSSSSSTHSASINGFNDSNGATTAIHSAKLEVRSHTFGNEGKNGQHVSGKDETIITDTDIQMDTQHDTVDKSTDNSSKPTTTVSSPSDHVLLNTRRARSLSPSPSATATSTAQK